MIKACKCVCHIVYIGYKYSRCKNGKNCTCFENNGIRHAAKIDRLRSKLLEEKSAAYYHF